ncbi:hypothetical protein PN36_21915 [Candidatus Thiomargarita nelsonii]|uniref:Uncharacterized protein n=1 Tax=Candidatus Thiomargarita nelsonii TaxID=1003181 RepID=A0A4E0QND6_9GAMM|nr:hypothetical protein PN36_21915 [Candidatus Thiomargarita nelsonii]
MRGTGFCANISANHQTSRPQYMANVCLKAFVPNVYSGKLIRQRTKAVFACSWQETRIKKAPSFKN